ncbi:alpha/beta hydrolase [Chloroflexota bacterium]
MHKPITFLSKGSLCSGVIYKPETQEPSRKLPAIVMAHGLSGVKELALPQIAERFADAGFVTLVFDYRFFGDSEGEPRNQVFPLEMVEDYRNAITCISDLADVDPQRIGIWGTSLSGGLVVYTASFESRVKAVVAQVPALFNPVLRYDRNPDRWNSDSDMLLKDRINRYKTGEVDHIDIVAPPGQPCVLPSEEAFDFFMSGQESAPNWRNYMTVESLEKMREFDAVSSASLISPTAIMFIPAENDGLVSPDVLNTVYEKLSEPKDLVSLPITHFEIYRDPWLSRAAGLAIEWYRKHL